MLSLISAEDDPDDVDFDPDFGTTTTGRGNKVINHTLLQRLLFLFILSLNAIFNFFIGYTLCIRRLILSVVKLLVILRLIIVSCPLHKPTPVTSATFLFLRALVIFFSSFVF